MAHDIVQPGDGSTQAVNRNDAIADLRIGGPKTPTNASPRYIVERILKIALTAGTDTGGGIVSWQNPEAFDMVITGLVIDVTTVATAACSISAGTTAVSATTSSANLIDTLDVHSATGSFDAITDHSTNGKTRQHLASGKWVTISTASGASAGLVGYAYIRMVPATV